VRWSRWFPRASPVDDNLFQGSEDPYPDHWRQSPEPWPPGLAGEDGARQELRNALGDLPPTWRAVISSRDMAGRNGGAAAGELGLTAGQERLILNQARAALRDRLASRIRRAAP
jgi:RNA polymerase sigma-70 factor (ECF subfamily)